MRALVTGCAGFIGSHLTESLLEDGANVVGADCFTDTYAQEQKLRNLEHARGFGDFKFVDIDLAEANLRDVVDGCDVVFHLAGEPGVRASWGPAFESYLHNNLLATQRLLEAVSLQPGTRFVFASSSSIYGDAERLPTPESAVPAPVSPYGVTKLAAEHLCQAYGRNQGIETVALRYFSVYGPRQRPDMAFHRFCRAALERQPIVIYGDGKQTRDFTFVGDAVDATKAAARADFAANRVFNIGGGAEVSLSRTIELIGELARRKLEIRHLPRVPGDARDTAADTRLASEVLGYRPSTSLELGMSAQFDWVVETIEVEHARR